MFDQNQLNSKDTKNLKNISESLIYYKCYLYYKINYYFFNYEKFCMKHSWKLLEKHI